MVINRLKLYFIDVFENSGLKYLKFPYLPFPLILYQMTGFSDDLDDLLGFLLGFSIQYRNNKEIKNPKNNPNNILSCMI